MLPLVPAMFLLACGGGTNTKKPDFDNRKPEITRIYTSPERVLAHLEVLAIVVAVDRDNDPLTYRWSASRGDFPNGRVLSASVWAVPDDDLPDTLRVVVFDREDSTVGFLVVPKADVRPPGEVRALAGATNIDLTWEPSPDEEMMDWHGYEVFASTQSLVAVPPESLFIYRAGIVTEPERRGFRVSRLVQGTRYYFRVSARREWPARIQRSSLTDEIEAAPRPEGLALMNEVAAPGGGTVLDLSVGAVRPLSPADPSDIDRMDLYFGTADPMDGPGPLHLKSVSLLSNRDPGWEGRTIHLQPLGTSWAASEPADGPWLEEVEIVEGGVYAVRLPEGHYGKVQVTSFLGTHPYRQIQLRWAYQSIPDYPHF